MLDEKTTGKDEEVIETNPEGANTEGEQPKEQNIENNSNSNHENTVPVATLVAERKKLKAEMEKYREAAEFADELAQVSQTDLQTLKRNLEDVKRKRQGIPNQQYGQQATQQTSQQSSQLEREIREIKERLEKSELENDLNTFAKSGLLEVDEDIKSDILDYAKSKGLSVKEAAYARYGDVILGNRERTAKKNKNLSGASVAYGSAKGGGMVQSPKIDLSDMQRSVASELGIDESEMAIWASGDNEAIARLFEKKK